MKTLKKIKIVLFCGGRGSATIIQELLRRPTIDLTLIVNAYDDGLSTGALRGFIAEMLGPSDFRKNLSYLLDPHSKTQYALKKLLEFRLPIVTQNFGDLFLNYISRNQKHASLQEMDNLFQELDPALSIQIHKYLKIFLEYSQIQTDPFDFQDCSLGNLIFAGAYLESKNNFNDAAKKLSQLVSSRGLLVNVSCGENRILVGLKTDGTLLKTEAEIVDKQSKNTIANIFLLKNKIPSELDNLSFHEKSTWLEKQEHIPQISSAAIQAISNADIILYGPGTQHSSLFPSYKIAEFYLKKSPATIKALVMNLASDCDIQTLTASDIADRALAYLNDRENNSQVITHIFYNTPLLSEQIAPGYLLKNAIYKNIQVVTSVFHNESNPKYHNGRAVVESLLTNFERSQGAKSGIEIFVDIHQRSLAIHSIIEEFQEIDWTHEFEHANLFINGATLPSASSTIKAVAYYGRFPEVQFLLEWLRNSDAEYLVLLTGDGEYRFRDVMLSLRILEQSNFAAVFGSRTQSRLQFKAAMQAAYGENKFLGWISSWAARFMSMIYVLRFGVIFSDPLTGFRIFKRSRLTHMLTHNKIEKAKTPVAIAKCLINSSLEIAEIPVNYRTFVGFADPKWRIRRGIRNLFSLLA